MSVKLEASLDETKIYLKSLWNDKQEEKPKLKSLLEFIKKKNKVELNENMAEPKDDKVLTQPNSEHIPEPKDEIDIDYINVIINETEQLDKKIEQQIAEPKEDAILNKSSGKENSSDNITEEQLVDLNFDINNEEEFKKYVKQNLGLIREIGYRVYNNIGLEKEVNVNPNDVTDKDIDIVYQFKTGSMITKKNLMGNIAHSTIYPKYKSGDYKKPENFRYLVNHHNTIKILDRLWCIDLIKKIGSVKNMPDNKIFKSSLVKRYNKNIVVTADENTQSMSNVVLLDISKAFDSVNWDVLEDLLISNLTRKTSKEIAEEFVNQYMLILVSRELFYNKEKIEVSKGIPTGLPSSTLIFTLVMEEIIYRWCNETQYKNLTEFIMNVYVDDIYLKILDISNANTIVTSLINYLTKYKLMVNKLKSRADKKLHLEDFPELLETDCYLGIPFTRDIQKYGKIVLEEFNKKKMIIDWNEIVDILSKNNDKKLVPKLMGFFLYKFSPFIKWEENNSRNQIINFIKTHYLSPTIFQWIKTYTMTNFWYGYNIFIGFLNRWYGNLIKN